MAGRSNELRPIVKLRSTAGTGYTYVTRKNRRNNPDRMVLRKYDPRIRQRLAWAFSKVQVMRWNGMRVLTRFLAGHHPGPDGAISKLYWSEYHKIVTELAVDILGADALAPTGRAPSSAFQTDDAGAPNSTNSWVGTFLNARAGTIYAGSSQIQRNIIGEMVLGLPKEPKPG